METYIVLDLETTGTHPADDKITEIGAVKVYNNQVVGSYKQLVNPEVPITEKITEITGITDEMVQDQPTIHEVMKDFIAFWGDCTILVGHNIMFDYRFLKNNAYKVGYGFSPRILDTLAIARKTLTSLKSKSLESLCVHYNLSRENAHRAYDDAYATYELLQHLKSDFESTESGLFVPEQAQYKVVKETKATDKQLRYLKSLIDSKDLTLEVDMDKITRRKASQLIDEIIRTHGRDIG